ncbi:MAG TPA: prolipoprotein diacylglyceryl transferase family protein [Planctomycetota bacterium]|nr:prolipoprotein diacylglyceryl transferase family protein [Planctomycetota bacterium]
MTWARATLFHLTPWTFAVPAAIVGGYTFGLRRARQAGVDDRLWESATQWAVGLGLVVSHAVEMVFYQSDRLKAEGWLALLKFWEGLSSYGGFLGAVGTLLVFYGIRRRRWWKEADVLIQALFVGWIFGRLGCTLSGDHPGPRTGFFLAFPYPPPDGPRHNLGLYEMLYTLLVIVPANLVLHRRKPPVGSFLALDCILYGAGRFALDFLRSTDRPDSDPRYGGLTLAHYLSMGVFAFGLVMLWAARGRKLEDRTAGGGVAPARP